MADKRNSSNNWFMNVGKSLGYGVKDFSSKLTPEMTSTYENNAGYVAGQIDKLKKSGGFKTGLSNPIKNNKQLAIGKEALANALSDIKSGKIYNKEREMKVTDKVNEEGMAEFGDGFSFEDFDDVGIDEKDNTNVTEESDSYGGDSSARIAIKQSTIEVTDTVRATARTVKNSTDRMVANSNLNTSAIITSVGRALTPLNDHVSNMVVSLNNIETFQLNDVKKSIETTAHYQRTTIDLLTQQNESLKKLVQRFPVHGGDEEGHEKSQFQQVFGGGFSLEAYSKVMKQNINEAIDGSGLGQIRQILGSTDDLKIMAANPIGFLATKAVEKAVPIFVQQSIKQIDNSFKEFIPSLFMRLSREGDRRGGVMGVLASLFGVKSSTTGTVNLGKFERGPIPFDGETKKAITEVIPGYLRKMLAVMSKQDEISFDYSDGKWKHSKDIAKKFKEDREEAMMSGSRFGRTRNDVMKIADSVVDMDSQQRKEFEKNINKFFTNQIETGSGINFADRKELLEALGHFSNESAKQLAAEILQTAMKDSHMQMAGSGIMKGRDAENKFMQDAEKNPLLSGASVYGDGLLELGNTTAKLDEAVVKLGTNIAGSDRFGMTTHDYLRDMKTILLNGLKVYPQAVSGISGTGSRNPNGTMLSEMQMQTAEYEALVAAKEEEKLKERYSREQKAKKREQGHLLLEDINEGNVSMVGSKAKSVRVEQLKRRDGSEDKKETALSKFIKELKGGKSASRVFEEQMRDMMNKPSKFLLERFNKFDEWMYKMVFPDPNSANHRSFIVGIGEKITDTFAGVKDFIVKDIFTPMKDVFFGENGVMNKENKSLNGLMDFMLGEREWTPDGNGKRKGGVLASMVESSQAAKDKFKYMLNGRAYTDVYGVKHEFKEDAMIPTLGNTLTKVRESVNKYLMGDKQSEREADRKGIMTTVVETLQKGANNWKEALFGPSDTERSKRTAKEVLKQGMASLPKTAAIVGMGGLAGTLLASGTGILGAIALPGAIGPILGMSAALGTRSETFMNKMFGEKDINGDRIGGIINRNTQEFFKKNKNVIIGGGTLGFLKGALGIGIGGAVGNAVLGPIGMAGLGVAAAMAYRSNRVQDMLFGKMDENTGERIGGLLNRKGKEMNVGGKRMKDFIPNALVGAIGGAGAGGFATYGLLGGLFGPVGLIGGALLGAASGIALSSDKFKTMIFGNYNEETGKKEGGVVGKFTNWFNVEVKNKLNAEIQQVKLNMKKWFNRSVAQPLERAIDPMKKAFQNMIDSTQTLFKNSWDVIKTNVSKVFKDYVGAPFGAFMNKYIMGPLKKVMKGVVYGGGSILGGVISAPFKAAGAVGDHLTERHKKRGIRKYRQGINNDENLSWTEKFRAKYLDREAINAAQYSKDGADYAKGQEELERQRVEREAKWDAEQARINKMKDRNNKASYLATKYGYEDYIEVPDPNNPGKTKKIDLARLINISFDKGGKNYRKFMSGNGAKDEFRQGIEETLGVPLQMLLGREYDEHVDPSKLSKNQRKVLSRAFKKSKGTLKGNALLRALGLKGDVRKFEEERQAIIDKKKAEAEEKSVKEESKDRFEAQINELKTVQTVSISNTDRIIEAIKSIGGNSVQPKTTPTENQFVDFKPIVDLDIQHFADKKKEEATAEVKKPETKIVTPVDLLVQNTTSINRHLRVIAQNVNGQLDGVGSNVYKTRKILQQQAGIEDDDLTGSANRDRLGLWGRFKQSLYRPFEKIGEKITAAVDIVKAKVKMAVDAFLKPFKVAKDVFFKVADKIGEAAKATLKGLGTAVKTVVIDLPKGLANVVKDTAIKLTGVISTVATETVKVAGKIVGAAGDIIKGIGTGIKNIIAGTTKGIANIFTGITSGISSIAAGVGTAIGSIAKTASDIVVGAVNAIKPVTMAILKGVGKAATAMVELPFKVAEGVFSITKSTVGAVAKFTASTIRTIGEVAIDVKDGVVAGFKAIGKTALNVIAAPFKAIGAAWRKVTALGKPQRVEVVGGYLDYIGATKPSTVTGEGEEASPKKRSAFSEAFSRWKVSQGSLGIMNKGFFGYLADVLQGGKGAKGKKVMKTLDEIDGDTIASGLSLTALNTLQNKNPNTVIKKGKYRNLYKTLRLTWTKDRPLPVYIVESGKDIDDKSGNIQGGVNGNNNKGTEGLGGSGNGSGDPIKAGKNIYKGGRMGAAGTAGLYSATKNAIQNRGNDLNTWKGFAGAYMGTYNKVNGNKEGKASAVTQVGSSAVSTPGVLARGKNRSSTYMSGGFAINKPNGGNYDSQAAFTSRKNVSYYLDNLAQRQEMEEKSMFRFSTVDLLSKIEYNTRRTWELLQDLSNSLPKALNNLATLMGKGFDKLGDKLDELMKAAGDIADAQREALDDNDDTAPTEPGDNREDTKVMASPVKPGGKNSDGDKTTAATSRGGATALVGGKGAPVGMIAGNMRDRGTKARSIPVGMVGALPTPKQKPTPIAAVAAQKPKTSSVVGKQAPTSNRIGGNSQLLLAAPTSEYESGRAENNSPGAKKGDTTPRHDNFALGSSIFKEQNGKWTNTSGTMYLEDSKPDYERYGYQAKTANGMFINPDGTVSEKPAKMERDKKPRGPVRKTAGFLGSIGKGTGKVLGGIAKGGLGIAGIVGATWLVSSLMTDGVDGTVAKIKNGASTGMEKLSNWWNSGKTEEEKAEFNKNVEEKTEKTKAFGEKVKKKAIKYGRKARDFVEDKSAVVSNFISDKVNKAKGFWNIAKNSDGEKGFSFRDFMWSISDNDNKNSLINSKLGQKMIDGWYGTKKWLSDMSEDYEKGEGFFKNIEKVKGIYGDIKEHLKNQAESFSDIWEGMKNLDIGEVASAVWDSDLKYAIGGALGVGAFKAIRGINRMRTASKLRNQDIAADDRYYNARGLDTRTHMRGAAKGRTFGETMKDWRRNEFGLTKRGRQNAKDERIFRRKNKKMAKRDLKDYDYRMDNNMDTNDLDDKYAAYGMLDRNGNPIRREDRGAPVVRNGRIVGYRLRSDIDMSDENVRGYGSRIGSQRINGSQVEIPSNLKYNTGNAFQKAWSRYAPHNIMGYLGSGENIENTIKHQANRNGEDIQRKNRRGGKIVAGGLGALGVGALAMFGAPVLAPAAALGLGAGALFRRNKDGDTGAARIRRTVDDYRNNGDYYSDFRVDRNFVHGSSTRSMNERFTRRPDEYDPYFYYWSHMNNAYANDPRFQSMNPDSQRDFRQYGYEFDDRMYGDMVNPTRQENMPDFDTRDNRATRDIVLGKNESNPFKRFNNSVFWETTKDMFKKDRRDGGFLKTYNRNKNMRLEDAGLDREERFSTRMKNKFKNSSAVKGFSKWKENRNNNNFINKGFLGYWADEVKTKRREKQERQVREAREAYREQESRNLRYSSPIGPQMNPVQAAANRRNAVPNLLMNMPTGPVSPRDNNPINPNRTGNPNLLFNNFDNQFFAGQPHMMNQPMGANMYQQPMMSHYGHMYQQPMTMPGNQPQVYPSVSQPGFNGDLDSIGQFHGPQSAEESEARRRANMTDAEIQEDRNSRKRASRTGDVSTSTRGGLFRRNRSTTTVDNSGGGSGTTSTSTGSSSSGSGSSRTSSAGGSSSGGDIPQQSRTRRVAGSVGKAGKGIGTVAKIGGKAAGLFGKLTGKGMSKTLKTAGKIGGMLGKNALRVGGLALGGVGIAAGAAMGAKSGVDNVNQIFDVKEGEKATAEQKKAAGIAGGIIGTIPFADMLDAALGGKMSKWIANITIDAMKAFDGIKDKLTKGWDGVKEKVEGVLTTISDKTKSVWDNVKSTVSKGWEGLKKAISTPLKGIKDATSKVWKSLKSIVSKGWDKLKSSVSKPISAIKKTTSKVWNSLKTTASKGWNKLKSAVSKPISAIKKTTSKVWSKIKSTITKGWNKLKSAVSKPINKIKSTTTKVWNNVKNAITKGWNKLKSSVTKAVNTIKTKTTNLWNKVKETITKAWDKVKSKVSDITKAIYNKTKEKFEAAKKAVVDKFTQVRDTIKDKVTGMYDTVKDKITSAYNTIKDKFTVLKDTLTNKVDEIKDAILNPIKEAASIVADKFAGFKAKAESMLSNLNPANWGSGNNKEAKKYGAGPNLYREHMKGSSGEKYGAGPLDNDGAYYSQNDARWANQPLANQPGSVKFGDAGCGPTAAAMLVSSVKSQTGNGFGNLTQTGAGYGGKFGAGYGKGPEENPQQIAKVNTPDEPVKALKFAQQGGFVDPKRGTRDDFFSAYGMSNNIPMQKQEKPTGEYLKKQLAAGNKMVIRGVGGRNFTDAGHYVVATGVDGSGKIKVKDPISASRSGTFSADSLAKNATDAYVANVGKPAFGSGENEGFQYNPYVGAMARNIIEGRDIFDNGDEGDDFIEGDKPVDEDILAILEKNMEYFDDDEITYGSGYGMGKKYKFTAEQFIAKAASKKGVPYTWGGRRSRAFDCSGLVIVVNRELGGPNTVGAYSGNQWTVNEHIKSTNVREGDLVFFSSKIGGSSISHVGIVAKKAPGGFYMHHTANKKVNMEPNRLVSLNKKGDYWAGRIVGFARIRHIRPGKKIGWGRKVPYDKFANSKDTGTIGDKSSGNKTTDEPKNSTTSNGKTTTKTVKKLISKDPFEKFNLMLTAGAASVLQGKRLGVKGLKDALYTTEKVTKYVPGKTSSSSKKDSKKDKTTGNSSRRLSGKVKQTDTVLTAPVKPKYKAKGVYNGNGKSTSYLVDHDLRIQDSTVTGKDLNAWFERKSGWRKKSAMRNNGNAFIAGAASAGIDPRYLAAHAALESEWGDSKIARIKHNFFGIGAVDHAPFEKAYTFKDPIDGMIAGGEWIAKKYPHGKYAQTTLRKMRFKTDHHQYATDKYWHTKVASTMTGIKGTAKFKKAAGFTKATPDKNAKYGAGFGTGSTKSTNTGFHSSSTPKAKVNFASGPSVTRISQPKPKITNTSISVSPKLGFGSGGTYKAVKEVQNHDVVFAKGGNTNVYHVENKTDVNNETSTTDEMISVLKEIATYTKETAENILSISLPGANGGNVVVSAGGGGNTPYVPSTAHSKARAASSDRK